MKPLKAVLPSLMEKKRYLGFEVISDRVHDRKAVFSAVKAACHRYLGELEAGKAGIMMLGDCYDDERQAGIIRLNSYYLDKVRASLCFITEIEGLKAIVRSTTASGILKKVKLRMTESK